VKTVEPQSTHTKCIHLVEVSLVLCAPYKICSSRCVRVRKVYACVLYLLCRWLRELSWRD